MAWQSNIRSKEMIDGGLHVIVDFFKGNKSYSKEYVITAAQSPTWLESQISAELTRITLLWPYYTSIPL